jgi:tetrahydromethanopterin S-methyltransferase subunit C
VIAAAQDVPAAPVLGLMAFGVVVALVGHVVRDRRVVGMGIAVIFVATALMVLGAFFAYSGDETDPRPPEDRQTPY